MEERKPRISSGRREAFVVCDYSLEDVYAPFFNWLRSEGFTLGDHHGNYGNCPWAYVNITRKQYAYALPGISIAEPLGNHAITIEGFKTIYNIYKKYEGKDLFVFHSQRFDYKKEEQ